MKYRSEIDGLRALAVVPVILFHAGFNAFSGGFVGVDVFFVISGYLITTILLNDLEAGKFSIVHFYERRARRILPALFLVMFACLPFAWFWLLPQDMKSFSQSLVAVSVFASNILFWRTSGYFDTATELKPLIHTWSLSVEEQYYVLFPLFLFFAWRLGKRWTVGILAVVAVISLALAQWYVNKNPSFTFYMLPTRTWELLIGAFVAFYYSDHNIKKHKYWASELGSLSGFALIAYATFAFSEKTPFPSLYALVPTIGAALIIVFATNKTLIGKLLSTKPFLWIGLISYSAYLWHQPLFAFARLRDLEEPSQGLLAFLAIITVPLAYLTWHFVERPFRNKHAFTRKKVFVLSLLVNIFFIIVGLAGYKSFIRTKAEIANPYISMKQPVLETLNFTDCKDLIAGAGCKKLGNGSKTIVLWGDSHAGMLSSSSPIIEDTTMYLVSHAGCPPLIGVRRFDNIGNARNCDKISVLKSYAESIKKLNPDVVILVGRWTLYLKGWQKKGTLQKAHHFLSISDDDSSVHNLPYRKSIFKNQLIETIAYFSKNSKVILVSQPPDYANVGFDKLQLSNYTATIESEKGFHFDERLILQEIASSSNINLVDAFNVFCDQDVCFTRDQNLDLLYMDDNHLSQVGAIKLWRKILSNLNFNHNEASSISYPSVIKNNF